MKEHKKVVVVMPAYNAARTLKKTYSEIPHHLVDEIIIVDDASNDETVELAKNLPVHLLIHESNKGYGGNQKTCYKKALELGADIIIMLHPDYQYTPKLIGAMSEMLNSGEYDVVLASRIIGDGAIKGGMPLYKYISNRVLTFIQNVFLGTKLSEYHTGYRAFSRLALESIDYEKNSNDFIFDNQILAQLIFSRKRIGEISCPTRYFPEASSINFSRSLKYGIGCLIVSFQYRLNKLGLTKSSIFNEQLNVK